MFRRLIAVLTALAATGILVGVAFAQSDDGASTTHDSTDTSVQADVSTTLESPTTSSTGSDQNTSTTVKSTSTTEPTTTSTTIDDNSTTSTSIPGTTPSTIDDDDDDDETHDMVPEGISTYVVPGVGSVTIEFSSGTLTLISVDANRWNVDIEKQEFHRIEIEFTRGDAEAEFEAEVEHGHVEVEIEVDSD